MTIHTPATSSALLGGQGRRAGAELALWLGLPGLALLSSEARKRKLWLMMALPAMLAAILLCFGCGGGGAPASKADISAGAQTYNISVIAHSASASYSVPVRLQVVL